MRSRFLLAVVSFGSIIVFGCGRSAPPASAPRVGGPSAVPVKGGPSLHHIDLPTAETKPGTAIAILIDTSGSMDWKVKDKDGSPRPKHEIARSALERIVDFTGNWKTKNPDKPLYVGIYSFSSSVRPVLLMAPFDKDKSLQALARIPKPVGGTAIGEALEEGYKALYQSGCARKYIVCITDGENTVGPEPSLVSRQLFSQTGKEVEMHFVAFNTQAKHFRFLSDVNGHVVEAADGGNLQAELNRIYEKKILAEKPED